MTHMYVPSLSNFTKEEFKVYQFIRSKRIRDETHMGKRWLLILEARKSVEEKYLAW